MDERKFYIESNSPGPPRCGVLSAELESHELRWLIRKKKPSIPPGADETTGAVQEDPELHGVADDKVACRNLRCRALDISESRQPPSWWTTGGAVGAHMDRRGFLGAIMWPRFHRH
jgi:hypothetical protein